MSTIYNQTYHVPAWVILNLDPKNEEQRAKLKALREYLSENGAFEQKWPSNSFGSTVKSLVGRGWAHAVSNKPFTVDAHFISVAAAEHVKEFFGPNKVLNLASSQKPWHHIVSRKVEFPEDYTRIFDALLMLQDPMTLSHLFDIGNKCHTDNRRTYVFFTEGAPAITLLRSVARSVIVVGEEGDVPVKDLTPEAAVDALDAVLVKAIRQ